MPTSKTKPCPKADCVPPKLGDLVRIRLHPDVRGRIVELRGALGPGGAQVYRLLLRRKPSPAFVEMLEDELEVIRPAPAHDNA